VQSLREVYERQARSAGGPEHWSGPPQMVERIAVVLRTSAWHRVLDVGCGLGGPARRLAAVAGCRVTAVDAVESVVRIASDRTDGAVRYVVADAGVLPFGDRTFDQVWSLGAVAHFARLDRFASECARVLARGGGAAITEAFWDGRSEPRFVHTAPRPWRPVTVAETARVLRAAGLGDVAVLPWPGQGPAGERPPANPELAADLADGRLVSGLVVARRT